MTDDPKALRTAILYHLKDYPDLGTCEWNCTTMEGFEEVMAQVAARIKGLPSDVDAHDRLLFIYGLLADSKADTPTVQAIHELIGLLVDLKVLPKT